LWWQAKDAIRTAVMKNAMGGDVQAREDREALTKTEQLEEAMDNTASGAVTYGYFTGTVVVRDPDAAQADEKLRQVERVITGQGFTVHRETLNTVEAWLGSLPGHCQANVRRPMLHTLNVTHLAPMTAVWPGVDDQVPLMLAETRGRTPFRVGLYERVVNETGEQSVGHTLLVGPSGTGKSMCLGLMALQFQARFQDACIRLFDKDYGLAPVTRSVDGDHYELSGDSRTGVTLQPLRDCDQLAERQWQAAWLQGLFEAQRVPVTPELQNEIWRSLEILATVDVSHRTLTGLRAFLQYEQLRQALTPYTVEGAFGQCLDEVAPPLRLSSWSCFETQALFEVKPLIAPTLAIAFHELSRAFREGKPTLLGLDESHKYLGNAIFLEKIEDWLRTLRKMNVSLIFSTQDLVELLDSPIATVIQAQCPIRILLPNTEATKGKIASAYEAIGLNERQRELLSLATPHRDYLYMSRQGVRMMELAIGKESLKILTGRE
jgi:type IV secretion system protein VirB4